MDDFWGRLGDSIAAILIPARKPVEPDDLDDDMRMMVEDVKFDRQFAMAGKIVGLSLTSLVILGIAGWVDHHFRPEPEAHANVSSPSPIHR